MSICQACGRDIVFVETRAGKKMPCDKRMLLYWADRNGPAQVMTAQGDLVRCFLDRAPEPATGRGWLPHWGHCPAADRLRKKSRAEAEI